MTVAALLARTQLRNRWRTWLGLVLLLGVAGGAVVAALAGARRTETAYDRFLNETNAFDVVVANGGTTPENSNRQFRFAEVRDLPDVDDIALAYYYFVVGTTPDGTAITSANTAVIASPDGRVGNDINGARVLDGRMPAGTGEVAVTTLLADQLDLQVGDTVDMQLLPQLTDTTPSTPFRVVGEVAMQSGVPPATGGFPPFMLLAPQYAEEHPGATEVFVVKLTDGEAGIPEFERILTSLADGEQVGTANRTEYSGVERSLSVQATALRIVALLLGLGGVLVLGQVFVRLGFEQAASHAELRALGVTRPQRRAAGALTGAFVAVATGVVAVVVAIALSPLTPVGLARRIETSPGVEVNAAYVGVGVAAIVVVVALLGGLYAWLAGRSADGRRARGRAWVRNPPGGLSTAAECGIRLAFDPGRGRTAVPVRTTIATVVVAITMIVAVVGFSASLRSLFDDPKRLGWTWDVQVGDGFTPALDDEVARLAAHPAADAVSAATTVRVEINGQLVDALATEHRLGTMDPTIVAGRAPRAPDEIMLGTRTLRDLDVAIGDTVEVRSGERTAPFLVVGRGVLTEFAGAARLGQGAAITLEGARTFSPQAATDVLLLRVKPGAAGTALLRELAAAYPDAYHPPTRPSDIADLERTNSLPAVLAGLLALLGIATLAHALVSTVHRRRRDLAVLKVLGFARGQLASTVAWQATALTLVALTIGVPLGVFAGQWAWRMFADQLGVPARPEFPWLGIGIVVVATVVLANLTALWPARAAARTRAAVALRTE